MSLSTPTPADLSAHALGSFERMLSTTPSFKRREGQHACLRGASSACWPASLCCLLSLAQGIVDQRLAELGLRVNQSAFCSGLRDFECVCRHSPCLQLPRRCITADEIRLLQDFECEYLRVSGVACMICLAGFIHRAVLLRMSDCDCSAANSS